MELQFLVSVTQTYVFITHSHVLEILKDTVVSVLRTHFVPKYCNVAPDVLEVTLDSFTIYVDFDNLHDIVISVQLT